MWRRALVDPKTLRAELSSAVIREAVLDLWRQFDVEGTGYLQLEEARGLTFSMLYNLSLGTFSVAPTKPPPVGRSQHFTTSTVCALCCISFLFFFPPFFCLHPSFLDLAAQPAARQDSVDAVCGCVVRGVSFAPPPPQRGTGRAPQGGREFARAQRGSLPRGEGAGGYRQRRARGGIRTRDCAVHLARIHTVLASPHTQVSDVVGVVRREHRRALTRA